MTYASDHRWLLKFIVVILSSLRLFTSLILTMKAASWLASGDVDGVVDDQVLAGLMLPLMFC